MPDDFVYRKAITLEARLNALLRDLAVVRDFIDPQYGARTNTESARRHLWLAWPELEASYKEIKEITDHMRSEREAAV